MGQRSQLESQNEYVKKKAAANAEAKSEPIAASVVMGSIMTRGSTFELHGRRNRNMVRLHDVVLPKVPATIGPSAFSRRPAPGAVGDTHAGSTHDEAAGGG